MLNSHGQPIEGSPPTWGLD